MAQYLRRKRDDAEPPEHRMRRHLGPWHLTFLGVGGTIGAGIFVLSGTVAANHAGPAVSLSYLLAALGCACAALCYAEFASMSPAAGSAYFYSYRALGELAAWFVGWTLILEYMFSAATLAVGWSGYFGGLIAHFGMPLPPVLAGAPIVYTVEDGFSLSGATINLPALAIITVTTAIIARGVSLSAAVNVMLTLVKVGIILVVIMAGLAYADPANWHPYIPANQGGFGDFGWSGVFRGAGILFFAYVGFDMISTAAQESKNPQRDLPISLLATLVICTFLYIAVALVMTGLVGYRQLDVPNPIMIALQQAGGALDWLSPLVAVAAVVGLASALIVSLYGQTRIFLAIGRDRLLPPALARLHPQYRTPLFGTAVVGILVAIPASLLPVQLLGELASIGTLLAFVFVCVGTIVLRRVEPDTPRLFKTPGGNATAIVGIASCVALMAMLPGSTWLRLLAWSAIGIVIYLAYGARHSLLGQTPED